MAEQAHQIVSRVDALLASARAPREPLAGPLHLGLIPTLAPYFLSWFIPQVKFRYPRLQLVVHEDQTQHLLQCLRSHRVDAALLALPLDGEDLEKMPLFDEPFWFACPPDDDGLDDFRAASLETVRQLVAAAPGARCARHLVPAAA